jgi:hypothetical protein
MEVIIKASSQGCPDSRHLFEVGDPGAHDALESAEVLQQFATLGRAKSRHDLQHRFVVATCTLTPMARDRESMRLVPNALNQA